MTFLVTSATTSNIIIFSLHSLLPCASSLIMARDGMSIVPCQDSHFWLSQLLVHEHLLMCHLVLWGNFGFSVSFDSGRKVIKIMIIGCHSNSDLTRRVIIELCPTLFHVKSSSGIEDYSRTFWWQWSFFGSHHEWRMACLHGEYNKGDQLDLCCPFVFYF